MNVTVIIEGEQRQTHKVTGRIAEMIALLIERILWINNSQQGNVEFHFAGKRLVLKGNETAEYDLE